MHRLTCSECSYSHADSALSCPHCGTARELSGTTLIWSHDDESSPQVVWRKPDDVLDPLDGRKSVGRYAFERKLGSGGMGSVYLAHEHGIDRHVAIKVVRPDTVLDADGRQQLLDEARKISCLQHPNIVDVYDVARHEGLGFIAMEWIDGQVLSHHVPTGGMEPERAGQIIEAIALGLQHAHARGIVHGDLKPDNVIIDRGNTVKILDFGLARSLMPHPGHSPTAGIAGTPAFMSPEQTRGETLDTRSDIFSLGLLTFYLLTGEQAFQGANPSDVMANIANADPLQLSKIRQDLDPIWQVLVSRSLEKDPNMRFQTMGAFLKALERCKPREIKHRNRATHAAWFLISLVLFISGLIWWPRSKSPLKDARATGLAVLPFENPNGDPVLRVFGDGMAVLLTDQLAKIAQGRDETWVVPASEIIHFNPPTPDLVHKELGVHQVITGTVTLEGSATSLRLALYAYPGERLLGEALLRFSEDELFSRRQQVFRQAGDLLGWTLPNPADSAHSGIPEAYGAYLLGRGFLYRSENHENVDKAVTAFHEALNIDSNYQPAKTGLADAYYLKWTLTDDQQWLDRAHAAVLQVIEAEPDNAGARITLGNVFMQQSRANKARSAYTFALELEPGNARAGYGLANAYYHLERFQEAEKQLINVLERYPNDWTGHRRLGTYYFRRGRYQEAASSFGRLIELAPRNNSGYYNLAGALLAQGNFEEALAVSRRSMAVEPTAWAFSNMGTALYYLGRFEEAANVFENAVERRPGNYLTWGNLADACRWAPSLRDKAAPNYRHALELVRKELEIHPDDTYLQSSRLLYLAKSDQHEEARSILLRTNKPWDVQLIFERAQIHELLGDREQALTYVEAAINGGFGRVNIMNEPELSALREDPRFYEILERTNAQ